LVPEGSTPCTVMGLLPVVLPTAVLLTVISSSPLFPPWMNVPAFATVTDKVGLTGEPTLNPLLWA
jgi:hypothetical protein